MPLSSADHVGFLDLLPEAALVIDEQSMVLQANPRAAALAGSQRESLLHRPLHEILTGPPSGGEGQLTRADGQRLPVEISTGLLPSPSGPRRLLLLRDLTSRRAIENELWLSRDRLQEAVKVSNIGIFDHDHPSDTLYWSPEQRAIFGVGLEAPVSLAGFLSQVDPRDLPAISAAVTRAHAPGGDGRFDVEHRIIRRDGAVRWVLTRSQTLFEGEGAARRPVRTVGGTMDTTERHRAEEALGLFNRAADLASEAIFWADEAGRFVYLNGSACRSLGYTREELLQLRLWDIDPNFSPEAWAVHWESPRSVAPFTTMHRRKDGSTFPVEVVAQFLPLEDGARVLAGYVRDVTERHQVEERQRRSEARLNEAQRIARTGSWELDLVTNTLTWSAEVFRIFELDPEHFGATYENFLHALHPEDRERVNQAYAASVRDRTRYETVHRLLMPDGRIKHVHEAGETHYDDAGKPIRSIGTVQDITERTLAEEALRLKDLAIATSPSGIVIADAVGRLIYVNPAFLRMWGYDREQEVLGRLPTDFADESAALRIIEQVRSRGNWQGEIVGRKRDGTTFDVLVAASAMREASGRVVNMMGAFVDSTEQKRLEAQLRQAQKMESIGRLAGGVAHDFNNLLTAINGSVELALLDIRPSDPLHEILTEVLKAGASAATLTQQLLAFSRKQVIDPRVINLNESIGGVTRMLQRLLGEDINLQAVLSPDLGQTRMDPGQLEQVLVNLAINARDAMQDGGRLTLETANVTLDEDYCRAHPHLQPGDYVMLAVTDEGAGMSDDVKAHLFEPFFTTKPQGRGTGLGLAMVYGAIKQNRGSVEVYSEMGHGTCFKLYLPRVDERPEELRVEAARGLAAGTETILLVEDDAQVRSVAMRVLRRQGYQVHAFESGAEALWAVSELTGPLHLLVTDVVLPGMNGRVLAQQVKAIRPEIRVLYTSGYTANVVVHHGVLDPGIEFIPKPYGIELLARRVREVLDRR